MSGEEQKESSVVELWANLSRAEKSGNFSEVCTCAIALADRIGSFSETERLLREKKHRLHLVARDRGVETNLRFAGGRVGRGSVECSMSTKLDAEREQVEAAGSLEGNAKALEKAGCLMFENSWSIVEHAKNLPEPETVIVFCDSAEGWSKIIESLRRNEKELAKHRFVIEVSVGLASRTDFWSRFEADLDGMNGLEIQFRIV